MRLIVSDWWADHPQFERLFQIGSIVAFAFAATFGTVFQREVQSVLNAYASWHFWIFLASFIAGIVLGIMPVVLAPAQLPIRHFQELMCEIQAAQMLKPVAGWDSWTFEDWFENFQRLAKSIQRIVSEVHARQTGTIHEISCNFMILFDGGADEEDIIRVHSGFLPLNQVPYDPYPCGKDDISHREDIKYHAVMIARSVASNERTYKNIHLRVHQDATHATAGVAAAIHRLEDAIADDRQAWTVSYSDVPDTQHIEAVRHGRNVSVDARNAVASYFVAHPDVRSFISIALSWDGLPVAVLNIESPLPHLFSPKKTQHILIAAMAGFINTAGSLGFVFLERYEAWMKEANTEVAA